MSEPRHRRRALESELDAVERAQLAFTTAGWTVERAREIEPDLVVRYGALRFAVEVKAIPRGSSMPLEDAWARACLQARHSARNGALPLALIVAPRVSHAAVERLKVFATRFASDVAVGVIDYEGYQEFSGPGLAGLARRPRGSPSPRGAKTLVQMNLFSDLNQWLLKVLLAPELPQHLVGGPRGEYRNAYDLAEAAGCAVMSAHRFVCELRREGFLDDDVRSLRLVRRAELFRRWEHVPSHSLPQVAFRMLVPVDVRSQLERLFPRGRACLGLFAAADELSIGHVSGAAPHVLVDSATVLPGRADAADGARNLVIAERGDPVDLVVRIPKAVRSVFRASVRPQGVVSADIVQVWLDVAHHPSRGAEQAERIWERYLEPLVRASPYA